ncbi:MAG: Fe2+-dependent dioxygenase, partial [Gammaproteobacteria bacterium]
PELDKHRAVIMNAFSQNEAFKHFALPKRILPPVFNRYDAGMEYGGHVDNAVIGAGVQAARADISITVFLSEPSDYDGGELVMNSDKGGKPVKMPAGGAIVYSSATIHQVQPVTRGTRYAAITWVQSLVREEQRRELLVDLAEVARWSRTVAPGSAEALKVTKVRTNLMRMWAEL